jgi:DNA-binding response OmpR family regulator
MRVLIIEDDPAIASMLPDRSGWEVCERLWLRRNRTPVLMLSARNAVDDKIRGLDAGAMTTCPNL